MAAASIPTKEEEDREKGGCCQVSSRVNGLVCVRVLLSEEGFVGEMGFLHVGWVYFRWAFAWC